MRGSDGRTKLPSEGVSASSCLGLSRARGAHATAVVIRLQCLGLESAASDLREFRELGIDVRSCSWLLMVSLGDNRTWAGFAAEQRPVLAKRSSGKRWGITAIESWRARRPSIRLIDTPLGIR